VSGYGLPRNFFRGPGRTNLHLALAKPKAITERVNTEFRVGAFNIAEARPVSRLCDRVTRRASPGLDTHLSGLGLGSHPARKRIHRPGRRFPCNSGVMRSIITPALTHPLPAESANCTRRRHLLLELVPPPMVTEVGHAVGLFDDTVSARIQTDSRLHAAFSNSGDAVDRVRFSPAGAAQIHQWNVASRRNLLSTRHQATGPG
jgi:hypothetical protein